MSNGTINGQSYVSRRNAWNKWDDWLESFRGKDGIRFDPKSFRAEIELAKERGLIVAPPQPRLCRRCDREMPAGLNSVHCKPCADWLWDRKQRRNDIVTCTCPECGKPFQKKLCVRQVCCGPGCMKIRKNKQRNGTVVIKPIYSSPPSSSSSE